MDNPIDNLYLKIEELQQQNDELRKALEESINLHIATHSNGFKEWIEYKEWSKLTNNPKL